MRASFLKSKIRSLRKYDLMKAVIDILLPDFIGLGDYDAKMFYRKGDKVYFYDEIEHKSKILEATKDITPTQDINLSDWSVVGGASLPNAELLKKFEINSNNNLMYEGVILNNVHVSKDEPQMNENDIWFSLGTSIDGGGGSTKDNELVIKNMVVQDEQPVDSNYLWGDIDGIGDIVLADDENTQ